MKAVLLTSAVLGLLAGSTSIGCGPPSSRTDTMMTAVRGYNEDVRWRRLPAAAARIPVSQRDPYLDEREALADDLRINEYDITRVHMGKKKKTARVQVQYTWHRESRGNVHKTTAAQQWERRDGRWWLAEERRVRGKKMPALAEPLPKRRKAKSAPAKGVKGAPPQRAAKTAHSGVDGE